MTEAEITITYREMPVAILNGMLMVSVPAVTLFVLLCSIQVWGLRYVQLGNIMLFIFALLAVMTAVVLGLLATSDQTIFLSRDGISLPFVLCPRFSLRSHQLWSELAGVSLLRGGENGVLQMNFKNGARTRLKLDLLPKEQIENLIVSIDVWAGGADAFPALLEARVKLNQTDSHVKSSGYTDLWEEELTRRFGPTNFIPLEAGHVLRAFTIERQLAFGGLSALYIVTNKERERFALKEAVVPSDSDTKTRETAERMLDKEARILASLNHPKIARVFDHFLDHGRHYILMELIDGEDLRRLVHEHGPQSEADVLTWADQLLEVLEYLHGQNPPVVHRDLSPDNMMLTEQGTLIVIDFGAANHFVGTATGTMIGKQSYIAPEQLRGKAEPASDIYAFGCTLSFLLTGQDPEPLSEARPKNEVASVSDELDDIVFACTEQEPEKRPPSATILRKQLAEISRRGR